jgi:hypothetical protein
VQNAECRRRSGDAVRGERWLHGYHSVFIALGGVGSGWTRRLGDECIVCGGECIALTWDERWFMVAPPVVGGGLMSARRS